MGAVLKASTPVAAPAPEPVEPVEPVAKPAPVAREALKLVARERKPYDPTNVREFTFPDGRQISLHRHTVRFATPLKSNPEQVTLVASKNGENPMPVAIAYADFMAWWKGEQS